jgi:hypothetical protein
MICQFAPIFITRSACMSKKYLTLEEAAQRVGITTTELNRIREKGMIRAFADRGSWKFKDEDVENLTRSMQADSNPDISLSALGGTLPSQEETSADLVFSEEDLSAQPTIISKGTEDVSSSDSDVRLVVSDDLKPKDKPKPVGEDSDSDVKLAAPLSGSGIKKGSDSDVKLVLGDDLSPAVSSSDSDVRLISSDSSGEVKLSVPGSSITDGSDSDVRLVPDKKKKGDSGLPLDSGSSDDIPLLADLPVHDEATINLQPAGAGGSSVLDDESGISLADDSSLVLAGDSGVTLEGPSDSGISLSDESALDLEESGISLADEPPEIKPGRGQVTETIPLVDSPSSGADDLLDTEMEAPLMGDDSSTGDSTNIITLDDESSSEEYETAETTAVGTDEIHAAAEAYEDEEEADAVVAFEDEVVGEDDELAEDAFSAVDEDFEGEVEEEESFASARAAVAPRAAEQEWGMMVSSLLVVSAALMIAVGTVAFDLVRNMWHTDQANQNPVASALLDVVKGM